MNSIDVFWKYLKGYHPMLVSKDWLVNIEIMKQKDIVNQELRAIIPQQMHKVRCLVFFYIGGDKNVVYLLQDERSGKNWAIALVTNNELIHAVKI